VPLSLKAEGKLTTVNNGSTDFLASFTFIPGTVVHLGYGSLYENYKWLDGQWFSGNGSLLNMKNSLFFKVNYLWRIK